MKILDFFSKYQLFIIISGLVMALLFFIDKALGAGAAFILLLTAVSVLVIGKCKEEKQKKILGMLFILVFSLHILLVLFFYYTKFQPFSDGYGDYIIYHNQAEQIAQRVHQGNFSLQNLSVQGISLSHSYPVIVGYIYAFTMPNMLVGQIFNAWLVALLVIFVYLIVREIGGTEKEAFLTGFIACFYPSLVFYGSLLLKEAFVILLALIALLLVIRIIKNFSIVNFFIFYVTLILLTNLRFYISFAIILAFIISWIIISNLKIKKRIVYGTIMMLLFGFLPQISCGYGYFGADILKQHLNIQNINFYKEVAYAPVPPKDSIKPKDILLPKDPGQRTQWPTYTAEKNSTVIIKSGFENPVTFIKNTTLSVLYSLFGPLPWKFTKKTQFFSLPEIIASYFLVFFVISAAIKSIKNKNKNIIPLIIFAGLVISILALFMNNFGIVTRIRMPAFLALMCLLPLGFRKMKDINIPLLNKIYE